MRCWALLVLVACGQRSLNQVRPILDPPPDAVDFGTLPVLNEDRREVWLENLGRAPLHVQNLALTGSTAFTLLQGLDTLEAGARVALVLAFKPPAEGSFNAELTFTTDDSDVPSVLVTLTGQGSTRAQVQVHPNRIDFGRVAECGSGLQQLVLEAKGTADLVITSLAFTDGTSPAFSFVGSTRTPATVKVGAQLVLTLKATVAASTVGPLTGAIRLTTTDPDHAELVIPLAATVNRAPVAVIGSLGQAAPGSVVTLDATGSTDPDEDTPLTYAWTLRSKPLSSTTTIVAPTAASTSMRLDAMVPGSYEVALTVTDAAGASSCSPTRGTVVAAPAQKLLVELFWDNAATDLDLHVLRTASSTLGVPPDDCFYQNRAPDWGNVGPNDDPALTRDALTGYGPEVFGYVNPIASTYRVAVVFANELLSPMPASTATVRVYVFGVLKAEAKRTLQHKDDQWAAFDVTWPSGEVAVLP